MGAEKKTNEDLLQELLADAAKPLTSMTTDRYKELKKLERHSQPLRISDEELREFRDFDKAYEESSRLWENIGSRASKPKRFSPAGIDALQFPISTPAPRSEAHLEDLVQQARETKAQEHKNSAYLAVMAGTLQELGTARRQADLQQGKQNRFNKRMTWVAPSWPSAR
jgi:hypothetical protein